MNNITTAGRELSKAEKVLIMVHGRGADAEDMLSLAADLNVADYALIAPQAEGNSWYPYSFLSPRKDNEPALSASLDVLRTLVEELETKGFSKSQLYFLGFSQGACLVLDFVASDATRFGGVVAFTGGLIGEKIDHRNYKGDFDGTPVFIGSSDPDAHVPVGRVKESTIVLEEMGAGVTEIIYKDRGHTISHAEIIKVNTIIFGS